METTHVDEGDVYQDRELQHDLLHHRERPGGSHLRKFSGGTLPKVLHYVPSDGTLNGAPCQR